MGDPNAGVIAPRARCRCGGTAAHRCGACNGAVDGPAGVCRAHPGADVAVICCVFCSKPLCFWHYAIQPIGGTSADGKREIVKTGQTCFPSCAHKLDVAREWRPGNPATPSMAR